MSAIEMMDPKMDAGMCCNKNPGGPLTFETAVNVRFCHYFEHKCFDWFSHCSTLKNFIALLDEENEAGFF